MAFSLGYKIERAVRAESRPHVMLPCAELNRRFEIAMRLHDDVEVRGVGIAGRLRTTVSQCDINTGRVMSVSK